MTYISQMDREHIENKYHKTSEPFNTFDFRHYHGYDYDASTGLEDSEISEGLVKLFDETRDEPHPIAKAKAVSYVLDHTKIDVNDNDYFVGFYSWGRLITPMFYSKWHNEAFDRLPGMREKMLDFYNSGTAEVWLDTEHVVPSWNDILSLGFRGLLDRIKRYRKLHDEKQDLTEKGMALLEAMEIEYTAILRVIKRLHDYALTVHGEKPALIAKSLDNLYNGAPQNTFDALETMYIYFMCSDSIDNYQVRSLGHGLDRSLYAFYKKDLEDGTFDRDTIKSFLAYFFMQFSSMGNYWAQPFYLCGTDFDEKTDITDLTNDILDAYESLDIYNPKIQVKIDFNTKKELILRILDLIRRGTSSFVFCCIPGITKSLTSCYGVTEYEARNCDISGCNEMHIRANEADMISALPNLAKAISYVFHNGIDTVTGKQMGTKTGEIDDFKTFDDFYTAYLKQGAYMCDSLIEMACIYEPLVEEISPSVILSGTMENSLKTGVDAYAFGVKYPTSSLLLCSFATAVDSLLAVKELVYDKKVVTLAELKKALDCNWEGYDTLRHMALHATHKYGNNDPVADTLASAVFRYFSIHITGRPNGRGGVFKVGVPSTRHFITYGNVTEATPDGRRMGEELSKNAAPVIGMERKGVTAMIQSALKTDPYLFSEAYVLDVMLHPSAVAGEEGLTAMYALLLHYMKNDGVSIQFNVFSPDNLRDAQAHPEKYQNLQVRVSGWNALWNQMSKDEQEAYIIRAESIQNA